MMFKTGTVLGIIKIAVHFENTYVGCSPKQVLLHHKNGIDLLVSYYLGKQSFAFQAVSRAEYNQLLHSRRHLS